MSGSDSDIQEVSPISDEPKSKVDNNLGRGYLTSRSLSLASNEVYQIQRLEALLDKLQDSTLAQKMSQKMMSSLNVSRLPSQDESMALISFTGPGDDDIVFTLSLVSSPAAQALESARRTNFYGPNFNLLMDQVYKMLQKYQEPILEATNGNSVLQIGSASKSGSRVSNSGPKSFVCNFQNCKKAFASHDRLNQHSLVHKSLNCEYCDKTYHDSKALKYHTITCHTKEYEHVCLFCKKGFVAPTELKTHIKKNYKCMIGCRQIRKEQKSKNSGSGSQSTRSDNSESNSGSNWINSQFATQNVFKADGDL